MNYSSLFESQKAETHKPTKSQRLYDFELCADYEELKATLKAINHCGYDLICVTQDHRGFYTVFFRRCGIG